MREKINTRSKARYRNYLRHLGPAIEVLGPAITRLGYGIQQVAWKVPWLKGVLSSWRTAQRELTATIAGGAEGDRPAIRTAGFRAA